MPRSACSSSSVSSRGVLARKVFHCSRSKSAYLLIGVGGAAVMSPEIVVSVLLPWYAGLTKCRRSYNWRFGCTLYRRSCHGKTPGDSVCGGFFVLTRVFAQQAPTGGIIPKPETLVTDGIPPLPTALAEAAGRYAENRAAFPADWQPVRREMLIATRFGNTYQLHLVAMPGGARQQLTFFTEPVRGGTYHPNGGDYVVFSKDIGGGEWYQLFRYDTDTGESTLLRDGKSRNSAGPWSTHGDQIAYTSTRRTGRDSDLWVMNPADPKTDRLVAQLSGAGWEPQDWSPDDKHLLVIQYISVNESYLGSSTSQPVKKLH
jgi:hypothetical protein